MPKPLVALVGRPNVGKSALFNRIVGKRLAVVDDAPGTTRDRLFAEAEWNGIRFDLVDTGGIEVLGRGPHFQPLAADSADFIVEIRQQADLAISEADLVVLVADVTTGVTAPDQEVAEILRRRQKIVNGIARPPIILAVNKCENAARRNEVVAFYELGIGEDR